MKSARTARKSRAKHNRPPRRAPCLLLSGDDTLKILDELPVAVMVVTRDDNPRLLFVNKQFTKTFGYTPAEIPTQQDWARRAYPDAAYREEVFDRWNEALRRAERVHGSVASIEIRVTSKDGRNRDVFFSAVVLDHTIHITLTDLTDQRDAERASQSAREQLERTAYEVTENIPAGTYTIVLRPGEDVARFTFMSSRFLELCGLDRQAAEQNPLNAFACVHPDDYDEWVRKNAECFTKKIPFSEECRVIARGITRWVHAESIPRDLPDGTVVWEGVLTDITRRKSAEVKLAAEETRLRKILDNIPVPVALNEAREDGRITFLNEAFTRTFGYSRADLPDVGVWARLAYPDETYRAETFLAWNAAVSKAVRTDGIVPPIEVHVRAKDGTRRDVMISGAMFDDLLLVGFVDLTARRKAEAELHSAREKIERSAYELTANIPVGTYVLEFDSSGKARFIFTSERWLAMLGLRREDVLNAPELAFDAVHPEERAEFQRINAEVFTKKMPFFWEGRIVVDGRTSWVTIESTPRDRQNGGTIWEGVMTDVTRRKTAETELAALREAERKKEQQTRENLEAKLRTSLTAAAAAHEINQPLGRILLTSQLVREYVDKTPGGDSHIAFYLRSLTSEAEHVVATIERMKSLMRNTGTERAPLDLRDLVDSAVLYAGSFARAVNARITFHRPARRAVVLADADQLQIALNNLLRNAIEAVAECPARRRDIRVEVRHSDTAIQLIVGDSGPGFPPGAASDQLPESNKRGGTGLGLIIVRTAAENNGARIETGVSPLGGAEVRIVLAKRGKELKSDPAHP